MGLLIVPFTVKGVWHILFDPVVLELRRSGIRVRGHRLVPWTEVDQWAVRYEYDAGGRTHAGESPFMSPATAMRWAEGDRVSVAYDPSRPEVSVWLGGDPVGGP